MVFHHKFAMQETDEQIVTPPPLSRNAALSQK